MTLRSPPVPDDAALPEEERAMVERARALVPPLAERAPAAAARRVKGGWRLSGRYPFSSGCDHAQWAIIGAFLGEAGDPRHVAYLLVPLADIDIVDDWQVLGLLGTGSKSLLLHDVFVPEHRSVWVRELYAGTPPGRLVHPGYPLLRAPRGFLVPYSLPPVAIALGRQALELVCRALPGRLSRGVTDVAGSEVVQMAIGEASAAIDIATLLLHTGRRSSTEAIYSGRDITEAEVLCARRDMTFAQHQVGWALDRLCEMTGARWIYDTDPLQAIRREVITVLTHHAASRQAAMVPYGRLLLGRDPGHRGPNQELHSCRSLMIGLPLALSLLVFLLVAPAQAQIAPPAGQPEGSRVFCDQSVSYRIADPATVPEPYRGFLGAWSDAAWDPNTCAALIVDNVDPNGTASIIYVFGPLGSSARVPGGVLQGTGVIRDNELRFQNSDGTQFAFRPGIVDLVGRMTTPSGQSYESAFKKTP